MVTSSAIRKFSIRNFCVDELYENFAPMKIPRYMVILKYAYLNMTRQMIVAVRHTIEIAHPM